MLKQTVPFALLNVMLIRGGIYRRFVASQRGVAAIEFAIIVPVLLILLLSTFDLGNAIIAYLKVRATTYELAAITNQYGTGSKQISTSTMSAITSATSAVMTPFPSSSTAITISQIKATSNTRAKVSWSYSVNGTALTRGGTYTGLPTNMSRHSCNKTYPCYFILSQVQYPYTPMFGSYFTGPITLSDSLFVTPRSSECVQYAGVPSTC